MLENLHYLLTKVFCNIMANFIILIDAGFYEDITANDSNSHLPIKKQLCEELVRSREKKILPFLEKYDQHEKVHNMF